MATEEEGGFASGDVASGEESKDVSEAAAMLAVKLGKRKGSLKTSEGESMGAEELERERQAKIKKGEVTGEEEGTSTKKKAERNERSRVEEIMRRPRERQAMLLKATSSRETQHEAESDVGKSGEERAEKENKEEEQRRNQGEIERGSDLNIIEGVGALNAELRIILASIERENNGKISFNKTDQKRVRESVFKVLCQISQIVAKMCTMEKEIGELKVRESVGQSRGTNTRERVVRQGTEPRGRETESTAREEGRRPPGRGARPRTYAEASKGKKVSARRVSESESDMGERIEGRVVVTGKEGWKTPPQSAKKGEQAIIVSSCVENNPRRLTDQLVSRMPAKEIGGPPEAVRIIRDGKLVVVPRDAEQRKTMVSKLERIEHVQIRDGRDNLPMIMVTGVERMDESEFIEKLIGGQKSMGLKGEQVKVLRMTPCMNGWKMNVLMRVDVEKFKNIVKKGRVLIGLETYRAEEYLGLSSPKYSRSIACYRCCKFGHIMRFCDEAQVCYRCGGEHEGRECRERETGCPNCWNRFGQHSPHTARDFNCPAMREVLARSRRSINYGS